MPTDNYDASLVMMRKRNATLANYKTTMTTYQTTVNSNLVRTEQPTLQSAQVVAQRSGGSGCVCDTSTTGYTRRNVSLSQ